MNNTQRQILNLETLIRAYYSVIQVVSPEERRVREAVVLIGQRLGWPVHSWSCLSGLTAEEAGATDDDPATLDPLAALTVALAHPGPALFLMKDFHPYLEPDHQPVIRALREANQKFPSQNKALIMAGPVLNLPPELEKEVAVVDFPRPGAEELGTILDDTARSLADSTEFVVDLSGSAREELIKAARGLTEAEAKNAFTKSLVTSGRLGAEQVPSIVAEKRGIIRKSGLLEYHEPELTLDDVGGLDNLKDWLVKRKLAFSDRAAAFGLPVPKGVLLLGVQGCGKSLCAKAVSTVWNLPLLRLDMGRIFESRIGGSENNIRRAIALAEEVAPCILWIDEIDKAFGGQGGADGDGGAARRVMGSFLTWLGEKKSPVFVAATANNVSAMPPEMLRKGRFDEIFFVDVPNDRERQKILSIHLSRRGRDPGRFDLAALALATDGFNGAEIEQAIVSGLFNAFYDNGRELTDWDITLAAAETVPLSKTMREEVEALRRWCHSRARSASESTRPMSASRLARPPRS